MSTIANLLSLIDPTIRPYAQGAREVADAQRSQTLGQTSLLELADLKAKQQAEQLMLEQIKNDPEVARQLFGPGPVLGSLGTAPAPGPPPGAITQSPLGGGPAQQIPAYPDASQFATQGGPPQSAIASLGPAGQPQMPGPQNPALEMARSNPRAAMMLQQQMQGQQDRQWKMQEQQLGMGVKVAEFVARELQGVTDQASLDAARERIRQVHPQAAAQVPQMYSKEAVAAVQQRGMAIADRAKSLLDEAQARYANVKAQFLPKLLEDAGTPPAGQTPASVAAPATGQQAPARGAGPGIENLSPQFRTKADSIADRLGANRDDFYRVMHFETGGEMSPSTTNRAGSGATGLIQFMPETAKRLGTTTDALAKMTPEQQLDYVEKYLEPHRGKIGTLKDLYMAVLYPAAIGKSEDTVLFSPDKTPAAYRQNAGLDANNKGYVTVGDAVAAVERSTGGARPGAGTSMAQASAADPRIAHLETQIATAERKAQQYGAMGYESNATQEGQKAQRLTAERTRLLEEARHRQERSEETPRAVARKTAETEEQQRLERQRQAGPMLPKERREAFGQLRGDILKEPTFKIYQDVRNGYQNVKVGAASDSAQGDLAIFNGLAKILDPTSSVMSGEAKNIEEAQGQLQRWFNSPAKFLEGDRISKENRPRFLKMAYELAKEKLTTAQSELKTVWGPIAKESQIDFEQLVPLPDLKPLEPGPNVKKFDKLFEP